MISTETTFLSSFVQTLDRTERTMLMLHYVEGLSLEEISQILRMSHEDVAQRLREIRRQTRDALAAYQPTAA